MALHPPVLPHLALAPSVVEVVFAVFAQHSSRIFAPPEQSENGESGLVVAAAELGSPYGRHNKRLHAIGSFVAEA
jgi:hypothetical protein